VGPDQREQVDEPRRWLADLGPLRLHRRQGVDEDRQRLAVGERGGWGEDRMEAGVPRCRGDCLGGRVVVADEIGLVDAEALAHSHIGQVEHHEDDEHATDSAAKLERVDAGVDEMAEQFGPRSLLLTR
jgi:hypothetical protein